MSVRVIVRIRGVILPVVGVEIDSELRFVGRFACLLASCCFM